MNEEVVALLEEYIHMQSNANVFDYIFLIANIATALGIIGVIIGAIIAYRAYRADHKRKGLENAVNLARIYQQEILVNISWILNVFDRSGLTEFIKENIDVSQMGKLSFSLDELTKISKNKNIIPSFYNKFETIDLNLIYTLRNFYHSDEHPQLTTEPLQSNKRNYVLGMFDSRIMRLLNSLEWFSMNFKTKIVDEKAVYQSLHKSFLTCVQYLYFHIAVRNTNMSDKLYTNIIYLYNLWITERQNTRAKEAEKISQAEKEAALQKEEIEREAIRQKSEVEKDVKNRRKKIEKELEHLGSSM